MKVLHLPTTVGGNPQGLSRHLKEIGVESETWALCQNYLGYPADKVIADERDVPLTRDIKRLRALLYVFLDYDVIHFNAGSTLFSPPLLFFPKRTNFIEILKSFYYAILYLIQHFELWILHLRNVPVFVHYQGDDARQGDFCLEHFEISIATQVDQNYYSATSDQFKRSQIRLFKRRSEKIYALNPDLLHVLPREAEFLPYSHISLSEWLPVYTQLQDRPLKIGHAPSHRKVKGTDFILNTFESLKSQGYQFDVTLVEGLSNAEAKLCYQDIDVLVDQLFAGWYGGLAVEAMALGKPVMVYIRESDLHFIPNEMRQDLPFIQVTPATIEEGLKQVLEMPRENLYELALKSRAYVERWHDPITIATRVMVDYEQAVKKRR